MKYPGWFPYPRCWLRAPLNWLGLTVWLAIVAVMLFPMTNSWNFFSMLVDRQIMTSISQQGLELVSMFILAVILVLPAVIMAYIRQIGKWLLTAMETRSLPKPVGLSFSYWLQGFGDFIIAIAALLLCLPLLDLESGYYRELTQREITLALLSNCAIQAYFYQARNLIQEASDRHQLKQQEKRQAAERKKEAQRQERARVRATKLREKEERRQATEQKKREQQRQREAQRAAKQQQKQPRIQSSQPKPQKRRKPQLVHAFPEEFLEVTEQPPVPPMVNDSIDDELEKLRRSMKSDD